MEIRNPYLQSRVVIPGAILLFSVLYLIAALGMGPLFLDDGVTNENFYPVLISIIGIPLCFKLLFDSLKAVKKESAGKDFKPGKVNATPLILSAITALFIVGYVFIGFLPSAFIYVFLFMLFFDDKLRQPIRKLVYSALVTAVIYVLYAVIFKIRF